MNENIYQKSILVKARRLMMLTNKKDVLRLESDMNHIKMNINHFSEDYFNQQIEEKWEKLREAEAESNLKNMPIDIVSTLEKGMPINALMNHGLRTIYDVRNKDRNDLMKIDGIGVKTSVAISEAVSKIKASVCEQAVPRMNPDHLSEEDVELLESIYVKWDLLEKVDSLKTDVDEFYKAIDSEIQTAKERRGFLGSLFQSKDKKERIDVAFEKLNKMKPNSYLDNIKGKSDQFSQFKVGRQVLVKHFIEKNASYYTEIEKVTNFKQMKTAEDLPTEIVETVNNFPLDTTNLKVDLRQYQEFGAKYGLHFRRTLLGDEMGLGKTIQALAIINHLFQNDQKYSIVVCPLSVLANWKREVRKHSKLKTFTFHGNNRHTEFAKWQEETGILLTTYEHTLRLDLNDIQELNGLIVDEAHYIKNPEAKRSQSVYELSSIAEYVMFMSGTPLENRLEEMKQLIATLQPNIAAQLSQELHLLQPNEFKRTVAQVYLRRNRKDVLVELPELEIIPQWMDFGREEREHYYNAVQTGHLMNMRRAAWLGGSPDKSPKLEKLLDICEEASENGHKVLIFSFFRDVIGVIHRHLEGKTFEAITGDVPNMRRQDIIDEFTEAKPGSVLISQITAGGVGLNIQAANIIILCEPQWKPSTEEQAISRAYRMGQSRDVVVYRLLTEDSIDVSMLEVLGEKAELFDLYARESEVASLVANQNEPEEATLKKKVLHLEQERLKKEIA